MKQSSFLHRVISMLMTLPILTLSLGGTSQSVTAQSRVFAYANDIQLAADASLPIFRTSHIDVNAEVTNSLSQNFDGIYARNNPPQEDTFNGLSRFTSLNQDNNTVLEQFAATGGFYAYNPGRAFGVNVLKEAIFDEADAQRLACQTLNDNRQQLLPDSRLLSVPGLDVYCDHSFVEKPLYPVSTETLSGQGLDANGEVSATAADPDVVLRMMVTMPIFLNAGEFADGVGNIPLGGPGGHISMIFDETSPNADPSDSLDDQVGLQALAMPSYGRSFDWLRNVPAVDPVDAQGILIGLLQGAYPEATDINVPLPMLEYFVTDAGTPQKLMQPALHFSGVNLVIDGQLINLRDTYQPAVVQGEGGVGPVVTIASPTEGTVFFPNSPLSLQGTVEFGVAPYTYSWQLEDGTELDSGVLEEAGHLPTLSKSIPLPAPKSGMPGTQALHLIVTDDEGAVSEAMVTLGASLQLYLPAVVTVQSGMPLASPSAAAQQLPVQPQAVNYSFGVEYGSDYPPYGPGGSDLGGVPPDANGFSSRMFGMGWPRIFNWYNAAAWERDWRDCGLGGSDCTYGVDRASFVYYAGHGSNGGLAVPSNTHDSNWFDGSNARYSSARWLAFSSCLTLRAQWSPGSEAPIRRWFGAFQGAHMLLGFNSLMADVAFGGPFVDNMRMPSFFGIDFPWAQRTIAEAWVQTAFQMNAGKPAYIWATGSNGVNPISNKLPKVGDLPLPRPLPANWYYWVWWNE